MTVSEFYNMVFPGQEQPEKVAAEDSRLLIDKKYLERVAEYLKSIDDLDKRKKNYADIISKPNLENGKLYEFLVYAWLKKEHISFQEQVFVKSDDCLKKHDYYADGIFNGIIFDVKKFGIGFPQYDIFAERLQNEVSDYYITVEGSINLDTKTIEKELISKVPYWKEQLFSENSKLFNDYLIKNSKLGIEIRAHNKKNSNGIIASVREVDITQWAKENELYFFRHASQFCCNQPYMIICPFLPKDFHFSTEDRDAYYTFRFLCRRMFCKLTKEKDLLLRDTCDGHAKDYVTIQCAARKLSAVMFLDISEEWDYSNCRCWIYKNPNADFPIPNYIMHSIFKLLGAYIDEFEYDNY